MVTMTVVLLREQTETAPPAPPVAASAEPSVAMGGVDVPDVRGMPASDARAELEHAGFEFAEPRATLGTPGLVLWTEPSIGRSVPPGTPVTIVIGVEAERLGSTSS
jgi:beta-lactam-binding protein with PASTA domain